MAETAKNKIGRPSMFNDKPAVTALLKKYTQARKSKDLSCYLRDLVTIVKSNFNLKGRTDDAIRQAVYRIVRDKNLYLSRSTL